ncbi:Calx-beta domain-containing protein [Singulisphaera acidiphila]|uniref:Calx-beta domain-containing protein n=1 Tax=Singulisphaera acidiphila (strain ATCC BAA-1392 / DSM 18658 / VKM B-2454 / MOB10) TaxID=886293 RepID=L0DG56_SINAD|nr:Calx-beta domain-containing protein [Singulisphaera acidiphila]AGA28247.1 Calx-beta domain-containing protein [Singulisphaera acidiphila DSM 18658]
MWFRDHFSSLGHGCMPARHTTKARTPRQSRACLLDCEAFEDRIAPASLSVSDAVILEGNTGTQNAVVVVRLSAPSSTTVTVNYSTANGSAVAGSDYAATSGTLTFAPGQTSKSILVPVKGDRLAEQDETFSISLRGAKNATIRDGQGIVSILDNEPRFSIGTAVVEEGNAGTTLMTFTVMMAAPYDQEATVNFATQDYTATTADGDYVATAGTLRFAPGEMTKTITVVVNGDLRAEGDERFLVNLSGASANAQIVVAQANGYIADDDSAWYPPNYYEWNYYDSYSGGSAGW